MPKLRFLWQKGKEERERERGKRKEKEKGERERGKRKRKGDRKGSMMVNHILKVIGNISCFFFVENTVVLLPSSWPWLVKSGAKSDQGAT